jgi:hypothetical protein
MGAWSTRLATPKEINWDALDQTVELSILEALQSDGTFAHSLNFRLQSSQVCKILRLDHRHCIPYSIIGRVLDADKKTVKRHFKQHSKFPNDTPNGCSPILTPAEIDQPVETIAEADRNKSPWTIPQLRDFRETVFRISLKKSTLRDLIERGARFRTYPVVAMDGNTVGILSHLILNMHKIGHQGSHVNFPIPRARRKITLTTSIALDNSFLKTADEDLVLAG